MNAPVRESSTNNLPKPKRRWFQFSLRTLMLIMLVFGSGFGWLAYEWTKNAKGRADIVAIRNLGGKVSFDDSKVVRPVWLRSLLGDNSFCHVTGVGLPSYDVADAELQHVKRLTQLNWLILVNTKITDAGLENLKGLTQLQKLWLDNTQLTDLGLKQLRGLSQLRELTLVNTKVTDDGLKHLVGLDQLRVLWLNKTKITDAGLVHLKGLTQLQSLTIFGTGITDAGLAELQKALPNCKIER